METSTEKDFVLKGGEYLLKDSPAEGVFSPENLDEEQLMIQQSVRDFAETHIYPNRKAIEKQENNIARDLLAKAGELGFLGAHIPEEYGGMGLDTHSNTLLVEEIGKTGSFSVAVAAHTGIGMLPFLYFGTEEQKQKYLPDLAAGATCASYCLTEPGSGSDALAAKTKAILNEEGTHYLLTGQKMWITNAGFSDVFIVFAQVDGDKFTGFIVDRDSEGLSFGAEEDKMGIKGSSTRQVFFENCPVPVENVLGKIGKGHLIAFNVLNIGRYKLGAMALGFAKRNADMGIRYANERFQFQRPISSFGAIQEKIAEQAIRIYALESALYRSSALLENRIEVLEEQGASHAEAQLQAAEEYAIECAILKVLGSETLDFVVDETVQIHGGNGFSEEYGAAADYRDSRINRIFEGTNEINRLLSVSMLLKRGMKGELPLFDAIKSLQAELASGDAQTSSYLGKFQAEGQSLAAWKKAFLGLLGLVAQAEAAKEINLKEDQEVAMRLADVMFDIFVAESMLLRLEKLVGQGQEPKLGEQILQCFFHDASFRISKNAQDALLAFAEGEKLSQGLSLLRRTTRYQPVNTKAARRAVAAKLIADNAFSL